MAARDDIDPAREDIAPKRRRRRRLRDRPDPSPKLKAGEAKATARILSRPMSPGVMLEPRKNDHGWVTTAPHNDQDLWELQLADAFGTRSQSVMRTFMRDLRNLCGQDWDEDAKQWKANERELNAALAMVADIQPRNTAEAALAAQMVAVHWMQMRLSKDALNNGGMVIESSASLAGKMARTYTMQLDQLNAMRGVKRATRHSIRVTKETHYHQHVHDHRVGGVQQSKGQPHEAPTVITGECTPLPCSEPGGDVVSFARAKGKG